MGDSKFIHYQILLRSLVEQHQFPIDFILYVLLQDKTPKKRSKSLLIPAHEKEEFIGAGKKPKVRKTTSSWGLFTCFTSTNHCIFLSCGAMVGRGETGDKRRKRKRILCRAYKLFLDGAAGERKGELCLFFIGSASMFFHTRCTQLMLPFVIQSFTIRYQLVKSPTKWRKIFPAGNKGEGRWRLET